MSHNYKGAVTPHCLVVLFPENVFVALAIVIYKGLIPWMAYS